MLMNVAVSVRDLTPDIVRKFKARKLGIEVSYFAYPAHLQADTFQAKLTTYQEMLAGYPYLVTMHGAFYGLNPVASDPMLVDVARFRIRESLQIAEQLGLRQVVFHSNYTYAFRNKQEWIDRQTKFWAEIQPLLESKNMIALLENTQEPHPSYILGILENLNSPHFKTCLDTGHSRCFTNTRLPILEWAQTYGDYLGYIHLHNNYGSRDQHLAFNEGIIDFTGFLEYLQAMKTPPELIIEVKSVDAYEKSYQLLLEKGLI